jgi:hypothetical protein
LVYGMRVAKKLSFADYWREYPAKRPDMTAPDRLRRSGDNNYAPTPDGGYRQIPCRHSKPDRTEDLKAKTHDLGADGSNPVLIGDRFCYFGVNTEPLRPDLSFLFAGFLKSGRGHRCNFTPEQIALALAWFEGLPPGVHGRPGLWPEDDNSWEQASPPSAGTPAAPPPQERSRGCYR